ncbi:MAG: CHASE2 domain-containing protein [Rhodocyclaceae bacterium]|nr:CHASE2 domain-containing protein [Rhodocyclaceae bacterium]
MLVPFADKIDQQIGDVLQSRSAPSGHFDDVVIIDVDEPSMAQLEPQIGAWPYDRHVYAKVNAYLSHSGAAAIAYDILFSEARDGDEAFAKNLTPHTVLAAAALPYGGTSRDAAYRQRLVGMAWAHGEVGPAQSWDDLTLPNAKLSERAQIGVISVKADGDGVVRSVPLLHQIYGEVLPSMAVSTLKSSGTAVEVDLLTGQVKIAGKTIIADKHGQIRLHYPLDFPGLRIVPFYQVVLAANGATEFASLADSIHGKTIFIGSSSAVLGDFVQTPIGRLAGLYGLAVQPSMLKQGMVLNPRHWAVDGFLALLVMLVALMLAHPRSQKSTALQLFGLPVILLLAAMLVFVSNSLGYTASVLLLGLTGALVHLGAALWRQIFLFRASQRLLVEKLAAEESARMKSQFLSHMTHELRTPLTAIMGYNNINWGTSDLGREKRLQNSEVIDRNGRHLLALINSILDQAKLEAGQIRIVTQSEYVRALVDDVVATLQPLVRQKPVRLEVRYGAGLPESFEIDAFRVRQILLNLTGNAIKFTERGSVTLHVDWDGEILVIEIADTGPGISPKNLSRLFVEFQQADEQVAATYGGTGLGLTISRDLAALMHGDITVTSEVGVGSRFTLRLPAQQTASLVSQEEANPAPADSSLRTTVGTSPLDSILLRGTVLVADDADELRALSVFYLKKLGLIALEATNGQEAVEIALRENPDAILMDIEMPVMRGLEAASLLRERGYARPILALSAHSGGDERVRCLAAGCNDLLSKPVSRTRLREALDGAMSAKE